MLKVKKRKYAKGLSNIIISEENKEELPQNILKPITDKLEEEGIQVQTHNPFLKLTYEKEMELACLYDNS